MNITQASLLNTLDEGARKLNDAGTSVGETVDDVGSRVPTEVPTGDQISGFVDSGVQGLGDLIGSFLSDIEVLPMLESGGFLSLARC